MSRWKQGDTLPNMVIDCYDAAGDRPALDDASLIELKIWKAGIQQTTKTVTNRVSGPGQLSIPLTSQDVAVVATFKAKVRVSWPDGSVQHYPPADDYLSYTVTR